VWVSNGDIILTTFTNAGDFMNIGQLVTYRPRSRHPARFILPILEDEITEINRKLRDRGLFRGFYETHGVASGSINTDCSVLRLSSHRQLFAKAAIAAWHIAA
jgi:hypothetical protein